MPALLKPATPIPNVPAKPRGTRLGHADLGGGAALGSRGAAEGSPGQAAVVDETWVALDEAGAAHRELGPFELGQRVGLPKIAEGTSCGRGAMPAMPPEAGAMMFCKSLPYPWPRAVPA